MPRVATMRTPDSWSRDGLLARVLDPVGRLVGWITQERLRRGRPQDIGRPVICIGNLTAGGQGKTPVALSLAEMAQMAGRRPFFLTRGYGGSETGPVQVDTARHDARRVGDEALLLARRAPTIVSADRVAGARMAAALGADAVLMDDGFQNPALHKTRSLIVVDGGSGFGNRRLVPAGPLRERPEHGLARAQGVVILGEDRLDVAAEIARIAPALPLFRARLVPGPVGDQLHGRRVIAFAGIGRPEKFFETVEGLGATLVARHAFGDHHPYTQGQIETLLAEARAANALPVTTAKDSVRLPPGLTPDQVRQIFVLPVSVAWQDLAAIRSWLAEGWAA